MTKDKLKKLEIGTEKKRDSLLKEINDTFKSSYQSYWKNKKYNTIPGTQLVNQEKNIKSPRHLYV